MAFDDTQTHQKQLRNCWIKVKQWALIFPFQFHLINPGEESS